MSGRGTGMQIEVRYFAALREALGAGESLALDGETTVGAVRDALIARSERHAAVQQCIGGRDAVPEAALRAGTGADAGAGAGEGADLVVGDVDRVDGGEAGVERPLVLEQAERGGVVFGQAGLVLVDLLADVHVHGPAGRPQRGQQRVLLG